MIRIEPKTLKHSHLIACFLYVSLCSIAMSATIRVPQDHATIKQAISSAQDGDEVIVSPGIYNESITNSSGINIVLRSTFNGDWSVVKNTVINANVEGGGDAFQFKGTETSNFVLRGFTITKLGPYAPGGSRGIMGNGTHATIEYNIISKFRMNTTSVDSFPDFAPGAGLYRCDGLIRNNIIEENTAGFGGAIADCNGTIQNNVIRGNKSIPSFTPAPPMGGMDQITDGAGGAFYDCTGVIRNNTIVNNYWRRVNNSLDPGGLSKCTGSISNNIIYHTTLTQTLEYDQSSSPTFCLFRAAHGGQGNIATADPKFIDAASGDFHLQSSSPAVDSGKAQSGVTSDIEGIQRGLNAAFSLRGDGSDMDIGAYEYKPKPVAVWLPYGGPSLIQAGSPLTVAWKQDLPNAGSSIILRLIFQGQVVANFGTFSNPAGTDQEILTLPVSLPTHSDYAIQGISAAHSGMIAYTPFFFIKNPLNVIHPDFWRDYL